MIRKTIKRSVPADLINAVYAAEGWAKVRDEVRIRRVKTLYDISVDHRANVYVATPKNPLT